jgi:hypothetical protein
MLPRGLSCQLLLIAADTAYREQTNEKAGACRRERQTGPCSFVTPGSFTSLQSGASCILHPARLEQSFPKPHIDDTHFPDLTTTTESAERRLTKGSWNNC